MQTSTSTQLRYASPGDRYAIVAPNGTIVSTHRTEAAAHSYLWRASDVPMGSRVKPISGGRR